MLMLRIYIYAGAKVPKKGTPTGFHVGLEYWARYSAGWMVQVPGIVQVKSLDTDSALNSAGPALLRAIPL